ncbi:hypothetical protein RHMOL_Rhmol05G0064500 [Rhododendron molle]|uniref:Uncharacterized protein n=1 Tax=Rhododendron molle TaxID=49168 RepID=A0ACC0NKX2_RHOML|nr:hypothetical protein RHMOL_Rhmol05G0064500 [Rhododendron molle]
MEDSCDQPHEAGKQIPRVSLHSTSHLGEESKEEEDEDDEVDTPVSESDTNGTSSVAELIVGQGSEIHCDLVSGGADSKLKETNLDGN